MMAKNIDKLSPAWQLFKLSDENFVPLAMILELTRRCHLRCVHCYLDETQEPGDADELRRMRKEELTAKEWKGVLKQLADAGCMYLALTGGEVFLRPDTLEIAHYARELAFNVRIFTTAMHVNEEIAGELAAMGIDRVDVSLYGRKQTHAAVTRCARAFDRSVRGIKVLRAAGTRVAIKVPLMTLNAVDRHWLQDFAQELGARCLFDPTLTPRNSGKKNNLEHRLPAAELDEIFADPRITTRDNLAAVEEFQSGEYEDYLCSAGRNSGAIDPYGEVNPCLQWPVKCGNIRGEAFKDIWHGSSVLREIRELKHRKQTTGSAAYCNNCPGLAYLESGDALQPADYDMRVQDSVRAALGAAESDDG
ncbi:MAG: radical SAM protein [Elusimicrobiota bacterium]